MTALTHTSSFTFPPQSYSREESWPAGSAVKHPPAYAGDRSSVPEPERSICWEARGSQLLSLCSRARELQPLSPCATPEAHAPERPHSTREAELEKSLHSSEGPAQPKLLAKLLQSCPTLCDAMDCSPTGSSLHRILQVRILEWIAMPFSRGSS